MSNQRFASAVRSSAFIGPDCPAVPGAHALTIVFDVTAVPGIDTVQIVVEGLDSGTGRYYPVLSSAARSVVGTDLLTISTGIAAAANVSANAPVPSTFRVRTVHSAASNFTYAISVRET